MIKGAAGIDRYGDEEKKEIYFGSSMKARARRWRMIFGEI
jgi:hypothetical protein